MPAFNLAALTAKNYAKEKYNETVSGQFNLHFSFGCSSSYGTSTVTFNTDGTFSTGDGFHGKWSQTNGNIIWRYDGDSAIYAGVVNGGAIVGNMITSVSTQPAASTATCLPSEC